MSYIELGNVLFRGTLKGARGNAKFKLTADAINVIDTIHIAGGQLSYYISVTSGSQTVVNNGVVLELIVDIPDEEAWLETTAYGNRTDTVTIDDVDQPNRNKALPSNFSRPFFSLNKLTKGQHSIKLIASSAGISTSSYIFCRYIRPTGG